MMRKALPDLLAVEGQSFSKFMGSGRGLGFSALPDWSTYSLLQVWDDEQYADSFLNDSALMHSFKERAKETWTMFAKNVTSRGKWDGVSPFDKAGVGASSGPVLVLTRASINWTKLAAFWRFVPVSQKSLLSNKGLLFTKGVGELPLVQMATISLWKNEESLHQFAYKSEGHRQAIEKARELKWFSEELFARFRPYRSVGTWYGSVMLPQLSQALYAN